MAKRTSFTDAFAHLLDAEPEGAPLPAEVARGIDALARRRSSQQLLSRLAGRTDLPTDLRDAYADDTTAAIRSAWVSHPARTRDEVTTALADESRGTVLAAVAEASTDPDLIDLVAERLGQVGSSWKAARALAIHPHATAEAVEAGLRCAARSRGKFSARRGDPLRASLLAATSLHVELAETATNPDVLQALAGSELLDEAHLLRIVEVVFAPLATQLIALKANNSSTYRLVDQLRKSVTELVENPALTLPVIDRIEKLVSSPDFPPPSYREKSWTPLLRKARTHVASRGPSLYRNARTETAPAALDRLCVRAASDPALAVALASNPHLDATQVVRLTPALPFEQALQMLAARRHDAEVCLELYATFPRMVAIRRLRELPDRKAAAAELAERWSGRTPGSTMNAMGLRQLLACDALDEDGLLALPWPFIQQSVSRPRTWPAERSAQLFAHLARVLGDDVGRWETFEGLASTHLGPLGELLELAVTFTDSEAA